MASYQKAKRRNKQKERNVMKDKKKKKKRGRSRHLNRESVTYLSFPVPSEPQKKCELLSSLCHVNKAKESPEAAALHTASALHR